MMKIALLAILKNDYVQISRYNNEKLKKINQLMYFQILTEFHLLSWSITDILTGFFVYKE